MNDMTKKDPKPTMADNPITVRVEQSLYDYFVRVAISRSSSENRLVKISEIVREALKTYKDPNESKTT